MFSLVNFLNLSAFINVSNKKKQKTNILKELTYYHYHNHTIYKSQTHKMLKKTFKICTYEDTMVKSNLVINSTLDTKTCHIVYLDL